uniref:C-type lectin domain-containing protein n=1 Tax=Sphenodon punctatus TaxID=8508 RepID=A0A8D0G4U1_SPHPU
MTEDVTYADLKFQESYALEVIPKSKAVDEKAFQNSEDLREETRKLKESREILQTNFSSKLQEIRQSLCFEDQVNSKINGTSCSLCPAVWKWMGDDQCYYISEDKRSWKDSKKFCLSQNSTLLILKDLKNLKISIKPDRYYHWIGLYNNGSEWRWEDGTALDMADNKWPNLRGSHGKCAYLSTYYNPSIERQTCVTEYYWICEKAALQLP